MGISVSVTHNKQHNPGPYLAVEKYGHSHKTNTNGNHPISTLKISSHKNDVPSQQWSGQQLCPFCDLHPRFLCFDKLLFTPVINEHVLCLHLLPWLPKWKAANEFTCTHVCVGRLPEWSWLSNLSLPIVWQRMGPSALLKGHRQLPKRTFHHQ